MFKKQTYNGEIWLEDGLKHFCVLEKTDAHKIVLKTNVGGSKFFLQQLDLIYGIFIGLGYMTFIGNIRIKHSSSITGYNEFLVKYCFTSEDNFINVDDLKILSASYYNNTIANLQRKVGWVNLYDNTYNRHGDLNISTTLDNCDLKEVNTECFKFERSTNVSLTIKTNSSVKFVFHKADSLINVISNYNIYKNFVFLFFGYFEQFEQIILTLQNKSKINLHYTDLSSSHNSLSLFGFSFLEIEQDYSHLLKNWYENAKLRFICSSVIDNVIYRSMNPHKRFLNSYYSLEGWLKYKLNKDNINFKKDVKILNHDFRIISGLQTTELEKFYRKCIRHRNYFVHTNSNQKQIFDEIDADETSALFDYVLMLQILKLLEASKELYDLACLKFSGGYKSYSYDFKKYMKRDGEI